MDWSTGYPVEVEDSVSSYKFLLFCSYFAFMSAAGHFVILHNWERYTADLAKGMNRFRWWEYMISHSLIMTMLFNVWLHFNWIQTAGCFFCCMLTIQFGDIMEVHNSGKLQKDGNVNWRPFWYGAFFGMVPWIACWGEVFRLFSHYDAWSLISWKFYAFLFEYWFLFWCFPLTLIAQYL